jgi:hypothetical protein
MLALGSLQIAKLSRVPPTAAMKHYHLALRRVAKNVRSPNRRTQASTLATTLLLGYFEIWSSDHHKWCNHLYGTSILLKEIPLDKMTRDILPLKRRKRKELEAQQVDSFDPFYPGFSQPIVNHDLDDVDVGILSHITGRPLNHEDFGQGVMDAEPSTPRAYHTDRDIENYEHLRDLFWWYTKMDVYQSFLGGTRLL